MNDSEELCEEGKQVANFRSTRARNHLLILGEHAYDDPYVLLLLHLLIILYNNSFQVSSGALSLNEFFGHYANDRDTVT